MIIDSEKGNGSTPEARRIAKQRLQRLMIVGALLGVAAIAGVVAFMLMRVSSPPLVSIREQRYTIFPELEERLPVLRDCVAVAQDTDATLFRLVCAGSNFNSLVICNLDLNVVQSWDMLKCGDPKTLEVPFNPAHDGLTPDSRFAFWIELSARNLMALEVETGRISVALPGKVDNFVLSRSGEFLCVVLQVDLEGENEVECFSRDVERNTLEKVPGGLSGTKLGIMFDEDSKLWTVDDRFARVLNVSQTGFETVTSNIIAGSPYCPPFRWRKMVRIMTSSSSKEAIAFCAGGDVAKVEWNPTTNWIEATRVRFEILLPEPARDASIVGHEDGVVSIFDAGFLILMDTNAFSSSRTDIYNRVTLPGREEFLGLGVFRSSIYKVREARAGLRRFGMSSIAIYGSDFTRVSDRFEYGFIIHPFGEHIVTYVRSHPLLYVRVPVSTFSVNDDGATNLEKELFDWRKVIIDDIKSIEYLSQSVISMLYFLNDGDWLVVELRSKNRGMLEDWQGLYLVKWDKSHSVFLFVDAFESTVLEITDAAVRVLGRKASAVVIFEYSLSTGALLSETFTEMPLSEGRYQVKSGKYLVQYGSPRTKIFSLDTLSLMVEVDEIFTSARPAFGTDNLLWLDDNYLIAPQSFKKVMILPVQPGSTPLKDVPSFRSNAMFLPSSRFPQSTLKDTTLSFDNDKGHFVLTSFRFSTDKNYWECAKREIQPIAPSGDPMASNELSGYSCTMLFDERILCVRDLATFLLFKFESDSLSPLDDLPWYSCAYLLDDD